MLVTLGIIGVISAMTLPTLVKNHQRQVYVTQLHKVYNELQQVSESAITQNNAVSLAETPYRGRPISLLIDNFKVIKNCQSSPTDCLASSYKNLSGSEVNTTVTSGTVCSVIASGATICLMEHIAGPGLSFLLGDSEGYDILIDANGTQGPNIIGRDLFYLFMKLDGTVIPNTRHADINNALCSALNSCGDNKDIASCGNAAQLMSKDSAACFATILSSGWKMDY